MTPILYQPGILLITHGSFTMSDTLDNDLPTPISVNVSDFQMDTNLVTLSQWQALSGWVTVYTGSQFDSPSGNGKAANHPVQLLSWYDVVKWCNARSESENLKPAYLLSVVGQKNKQRTNREKT